MTPSEVTGKLTRTATIVEGLNDKLERIEEKLDSGKLSKSETDYKLLIGVLLAAMTGLGNLIVAILKEWVK